MTALFAVYDAMQFLGPPIHTVCVGQACSAAAVLLAAGEPGHRSALPNARILIHQPHGGAQGQSSDMEIAVREMVTMRERMIDILTERTGQPRERIVADIDRDYILRGEEAVAYGLVDEVIAHRKPRPVARLRPPGDEAAGGSSDRPASRPPDPADQDGSVSDQDGASSPGAAGGSSGHDERGTRLSSTSAPPGSAAPCAVAERSAVGRRQPGPAAHAGRGTGGSLDGASGSNTATNTWSSPGRRRTSRPQPADACPTRRGHGGDVARADHHRTFTRRRGSAPWRARWSATSAGCSSTQSPSSVTVGHGAGERVGRPPRPAVDDEVSGPTPAAGRLRRWTRPLRLACPVRA